MDEVRLSRFEQMHLAWALDQRLLPSFRGLDSNSDVSANTLELTPPHAGAQVRSLNEREVLVQRTLYATAVLAGMFSNA